MKSILVFDNLNDIIYLNCCHSFVKHVAKLASTQGLVSSEHSVPFGKGKKAVDPNILIQLFAPLVTSQRFMREQFGNPYTSLQCEDGTNIVFQDYMGFLFLKIGTEDITYLRRALGVTITLVSYVCGPDVSVLKKSQYHSNLLDNLIETWDTLYTTDQSFMIEGIQQMKVNPQLNSSLIKSLHQLTGKLQSQLGSNINAVLFLETKILSWYSTKHAYNLGPEDLLFLILLCQKTWRKTGSRKSSKEWTVPLVPGPSASHSHLPRSRSRSASAQSGDPSSELDSVDFHTSREDLDDESLEIADWDVVETAENFAESIDTLVKYGVLLKSEQEFIPQLVHIGMIQEGLYLVLMSEPPSGPIIKSSCSALQQAIQFHSKIREPSDKTLYDQLDSITKKLQDSLKKQKNMNLRNELGSRWDRFKSGYQLYLKSKDPISVQASPIVDIYREVFRTYFNEKLVSTPSPSSNSSEGLTSAQEQPLDIVWRQIKTDTEDFWGFLRLKANSNLLQESVENLSVSKYLEEFPGLVHFIYVDRNKHMVILPCVDFAKEETVKLTKTKIWGMVKFARDHMQQGHFSLMWKDGAFNYAYFLWFEDLSGTPIRAKQPAMPWEGYPLPGIMCGDFYKRVISECFPNILPSKVRCLELFCIHLGLATSSCVLEHSKRLATNIFDEFSAGNPASDLL